MVKIYAVLWTFFQADIFIAFYFLEFVNPILNIVIFEIQILSQINFF